MPAEIENPALTRAAFAELEAKYATFNKACEVELQEMNTNVIQNIISRKGDAGWQTTEFSLTKSFEFSTFEAAQAFVQNVGEYANKLDHHPEWQLSNGGRTVDVKLTSHFANNTVTRLDFQLAEAMNEAYTLTNSTFVMFPLIQSSQWLSIKILAFSIAFGLFWYRYSVRRQC